MKQCEIKNMNQFNSTKNEWVEPEAGPSDDCSIAEIAPNKKKVELRHDKEPEHEYAEPKYPSQVPVRTDESHIAVSFSVRFNIYPMTIALGVIGCLYGVYHLIVKTADK